MLLINVLYQFNWKFSGSYYSDALFYLSLGLHRIAPVNQDRVIMLDCDLYFKNDVALLFKEFNRYASLSKKNKQSQLCGLFIVVLNRLHCLVWHQS